MNNDATRDTAQRPNKEQVSIGPDRQPYQAPTIDQNKLSLVVCGSFSGAVDSGGQTPEPGGG